METIENLYKLVERQVEVLDRLVAGPVETLEEWHDLVRGIMLASGGLLPAEVWRAVRLMTEHGLYASLYYTRRLYLMLVEAFPEAVRFYVARGWIKPSAERPPTTIQVPRRLEEELGEGG